MNVCYTLFTILLNVIHVPNSVIELGFFIETKKKTLQESLFIYGFYYALRTLVAWGPR
jgi:predicted membrane-bound mannosyltransferase